jgi:hypothetical protein
VEDRGASVHSEWRSSGTQTQIYEGSERSHAGPSSASSMQQDERRIGCCGMWPGGFHKLVGMRIVGDYLVFLLPIHRFAP